VKLSSELGKRSTGRTLYILDEPTTGLHFRDIQKLLEVLNKLVATGNTVLVIEHNLDVIKTADWIIDMGPEGGDGGGTVVAVGTPEQVAEVAKSHTGQFLKKVLQQVGYLDRPEPSPNGKEHGASSEPEAKARAPRKSAPRKKAAAAA
jgi:excinuclease ABC subunit A